MKLLYYPLNLELKLKSNKINLLVVENPHMLDAVVTGMDKSINKGENFLAFCSDDTEVCSIKSCAFITSPLELHFDRKEVEKKLIQYLLEEVQGSVLEEEFLELRERMMGIAEAIQEKADYPLDLEYDMNLESFFKSCKFHVRDPEGRFIERLLDYMDNMQRLIGKINFVLLGASQYLSEDDYMHIQRFVEYRGIYLTMLEARQICLPDVLNTYIIDNDLCEIYTADI